MATKIAWANETWSPVIGCTKIAAGCKNCYAERMATRLATMPLQSYYRHVVQNGKWNGDVYCLENRLSKPLHWRKPRKIFVCSMSDLFHEKVNIGFLTHVFDTIKACPQHIFQLLTKRPSRALEMMWGPHGNGWRYFGEGDYHKNIHFGVSCSTQADLNRMAEDFFPIPAAVRFLSLEPLLEPIRLDGVFIKQRIGHSPGYFLDVRPGLHWCVIGCESGSGARPCKDEWVISIVNQCNEAIPRIPVFTKQLARDGKAWKLTEKNRNEWPDWAVHEYPI